MITLGWREVTAIIIKKMSLMQILTGIYLVKARN